jgi:peptidoglycan hydrolase-like protein with peptidoglycan-binding domain
VHLLQVFLNTHGFVLTTSGPGAPGNETDYFGAATFDAVKRFQMAYKDEVLTPVGLTTPSGFFGPATIGKVNELLGR